MSNPFLMHLTIRPPLARGIAAVSTGQCFDSTLIQSYTKKVPVIGATRGAVLTEQVRNGFYWWIPLVNGIVLTGNVLALDLFLVEPRVYPIKLPLESPFGVAVTPDGCYKVVPPSGETNDSGLIFRSSGFGGRGGRAAASVNQLPALFVPGGWALLLAEATALGVDRELEMRFLKAEITDGCPPPF